LEEIGFMAGYWETTGTFAGTEFKGTSRRSWAPNKLCLVMHGSSNVMKSTGIIGWDPVTKEIVETWHNGLGARVELRYKDRTETVWEGTALVHRLDGEIERGSIRLEKTGDDSFKFHAKMDDYTVDSQARRIQTFHVQQAPQPNEHLAGLKPFIGSWIYDGPLKDEIPGLAKKGERIVATNSFRWILGGNAIRLTYETTKDGELIDAGEAVIGWDGTTEKIMEWAFTDAGNHYGEWKPEGDTWVYSNVGTGSVGASRGDTTYTEIDRSGYTFQVKNWNIDGQDLGETQKYRFRRVGR
jgi:hypothetical protein